MHFVYALGGLAERILLQDEPKDTPNYPNRVEDSCKVWDQDIAAVLSEPGNMRGWEEEQEEEEGAMGRTLVDGAIAALQSLCVDNTADKAAKKGTGDNGGTTVTPQTCAAQVASWMGATEEFEKDDLSLGHVDFVTAASNLRCR